MTFTNDELERTKFTATTLLFQPINSTTLLALINRLEAAEKVIYWADAVKDDMPPSAAKAKFIQELEAWRKSKGEK